jgi:hypothetical protein
MSRIALGLLVAVPALLAQTQPTFYAAYQDGLEAESRQDWSAAASAYGRAIALRPASAAVVIIYGNNLLKDYSPYGHLAHCQLELGQLEAATATLAHSESHHEPLALREHLLRRLREARAAGILPPKPLPSLPPSPITATTPKAPPPSEVAPSEAVPVVPIPPPSTPPVPEAVAPRSERTPALDLRTKAPEAAASNPGAVVPPAALPPGSNPGWSPWRVLGFGVPLLLGAFFWAFRRRRNHGAGMAFQEPKQVGPYHLERLLGRGGFASTYLARHETNGAKVALKVLHPYRIDDPEFLERFHQEAKLGAMLDHPNLVRLLDPGPDTGTPWLAMEYVPGQRLDQVLKQSGALPLPRLLCFAREIADGLAQAHRLGIVHRDLKPSNVIIAGDHLKIMDFGISRIVDSETLTTTYAFLGTPLYAAPEAQLKTHIGPAADLYAFGIMLFEMLTGRPPYGGETPFEILNKHRSAPLPDPATLRPEAPLALVALIERLCRKDPDQRPQDEEVIEILQSLSVAV